MDGRVTLEGKRINTEKSWSMEDRVREKGKSVWWSTTVWTLHYVNLCPCLLWIKGSFCFLCFCAYVSVKVYFLKLYTVYIKLILAPLKNISLYYQLCGDFSHFKAFWLSGLDWCWAKQLPKPPNPHVKLLRVDRGQTREGARQAATGRWPDR